MNERKRKENEKKKNKTQKIKKERQFERKPSEFLFVSCKCVVSRVSVVVDGQSSEGYAMLACCELRKYLVVQIRRDNLDLGDANVVVLVLVDRLHLAHKIVGGRVMSFIFKNITKI